MFDKFPRPDVDPSRVGVLDLRAGDLERYKGLVAWLKSDGDNLEADLDRFKLTPEMFKLLDGLSDCLKEFVR